MKKIQPQINDENGIYNKDKDSSNGKGDAPWGSHSDYGNKGNPSNYWCIVLERAATKNAGIVELKTMEEAQHYANRGYIVIGSYFNKTGAPHFVTVRPGSECSVEEGALVAHVGAGENGEKRVFGKLEKNAAFKSMPPQNIKWYYNKRQELRLDWSHVNRFRWREK
jgi:hypothetical protein